MEREQLWWGSNESKRDISVAVWHVKGPIALTLDGVEDQSRLAAELSPLSSSTFTEAVLALTLRSHFAWLVACPEGITGVWGVGGGGGKGWLGAAVLVILVADGTAAAIHALRPVAPLVSWVVE